MDDNKMGFVDYFWAGALFIMAMLLASCEPESETMVVCTEIYQPVCVDGKTFPNACYAERVGYDNNELTLGECNN